MFLYLLVYLLISSSSLSLPSSGNKEAADWLMHDPNRYNVMPDKDSKAFFADGEDPDKLMNDDPIRLDKQLQENYNDYSKENTNKEANYLGGDDQLLSDMDQKIINKAYQIEDNDRANNFETGNKQYTNNDVNPKDSYSETGNKQYMNNDVDPKDSYSDSFSNNYEDKTYDNKSPETSRESNEPVIKITDGDEENSKDESHLSSESESHSKGSGHEENKVPDSEPMIKVTNDNDGISKNGAKPEAEETNVEKTQSGKKNTGDDEKIANQSEQKSSDNDSHKEAIDKVSVEKDHHAILPIYRLSPLQQSHEGIVLKKLKLTTAQPIAQPGTSRGNVLLGSNPVATEDPQEMASRLNSFANMMLAKTEEERIAKLYKNPQDTHQDNLVQSRSTPQEPAEGQSRHGIPSKYGEWNGWSKCSVTCSKGTQIRARMCLDLPCSTKDLYQTRTCIRNLCPDKWREESLEAHNHLRGLHHSPPLIWSNSLAKKAKNLANALAAMDYIGSQDLHEEKGENIAQLRTEPGRNDELAKKAVDLWNKEENNYSFSYPRVNPSNRHFIQMIWKRTKTLGMASTGSRSGEYTFVVALYGGHGIDNKLLRDNVLRAGKKHDVYTTFKRSYTHRKTH